MPYCPDCRTFHFKPDTHSPTWETNVIEWADQTSEDANWRSYRASDAEEAAERAAEDYDSEDYTLMKGHSIVIEVRLQGTLEIVKFQCRGESLPHYYAKEIIEEELIEILEEELIEIIEEEPRSSSEGN